MDIMSQVTCEVSERTLCQFVSLGRMLVALDSFANIREMRTSLPLFAIKHICQLLTVEEVSDFRHGNKSRYNHIMHLDKNVYGGDVTSSKLLLATYWLQHGDYSKSLHSINDALSSIPPYALYYSGIIISNIESKCLYNDMYRNDDSDVTTIAREAWLFDIHMKKMDYGFVPRAIQIELYYCDPEIGIYIPQMTYAFYLMFICYHGLEQYDKRDRALRQLIDTVSDSERSLGFRNSSFNIAGHCLLMTGQLDMARYFFTRSTRITQEISSVFDKYNAAYIYLSNM